MAARDREARKDMITMAVAKDLKAEAGKAVVMMIMALRTKASKEGFLMILFCVAKDINLDRLKPTHLEGKDGKKEAGLNVIHSKAKGK